LSVNDYFVISIYKALTLMLYIAVTNVERVCGNMLCNVLRYIVW